MKQYYTKAEIIENYNIKKHLYQTLVNSRKLIRIKVDDKREIFSHEGEKVAFNKSALRSLLFFLLFLMFS
jgi:DNA-binding SARP family transcriptional activator